MSWAVGSGNTMIRMKQREHSRQRQHHDYVASSVRTRLLFQSSGKDESSNSKHGKTSVNNLSLLRNSKFQSRQVSIGALVLCLELVVHGRGRVNEKRIREGKRTDGGHQGKCEKVNVGNQDDRTFVGDGVLSRDGGESSPLLEVKDLVRVGDQAVALAVCSGTDEQPTKHGMTSVPLFSLHGWTPSPLGKFRELVVKVLSCFGHVKHVGGRRSHTEVNDMGGRKDHEQ